MPTTKVKQKKGEYYPTWPMQISTKSQEQRLKKEAKERGLVVTIEKVPKNTRGERWVTISKPPKSKHRKHTPIVSRQQQKLFGAELSRREAGEPPQMKGITKVQLKEHLEESKGKKLPTIKLVKLHDDGDMTVKLGGRQHIVTPKGKVFSELPKRAARSIKTGLTSMKRGQVYHTKVRGGTLLSRRSLARRRK